MTEPDQLKGYVNANDVLEARNNQITSLKEIIRDDMPTVEKETPIQEIFDVIHDSPVPVAVTEEGKLRGIIIKGTLIAALANVNGNGVEDNA